VKIQENFKKNVTFLMFSGERIAWRRRGSSTTESWIKLQLYQNLVTNLVYYIGWYMGIWWNYD